MLAGNTVLKSGEQVNVSRAAAGDSKAPLAMSVTNAPNSPAYDPSWLNDPNGIVNVAMLKAIMEAGGVGGFDPSVENLFTATQVFCPTGIHIGIRSKTSAFDNRGIWVHVVNPGAYYGNEMTSIEGAGTLLISMGTLDLRNSRVVADEDKIQIGNRGSIGDVLTKTSRGVGWFPPASGGGGSVNANEILEKVRTFHDKAACPYDYTAGPKLPKGWYRVEALLSSSNGTDAMGLLDSVKVLNGKIINALGLAYCGTDNGYCPYISYDGLNWLGQDGQPRSQAMCSSIQISFLYCHEGEMYEEPGWMNSSKMAPYSDISLMQVRYTAIGLPPEESRNYTTSVPTNPPTLPPDGGETTSVPSDGPTEPPTNPPTDPPMDSYYIKVIPSSSTFDEGGEKVSGSNSITIDSNMDEFYVEYGSYYAPSGTDWARVPVTSGVIPSSHIVKLPLTVEGNDTVMQRAVTHRIFGKLSKTGQTLSAALEITQYGGTTLVPTEAPRQSPAMDEAGTDTP